MTLFTECGQYSGAQVRVMLRRCDDGCVSVMICVCLCFFYDMCVVRCVAVFLLVVICWLRVACDVLAVNMFKATVLRVHV